MRLDNYNGEAPPSGLYAFSGTVRAGIDGFDAVTAAAIEQFHALGFLVIHNAIALDTVQAARAALRELILRGAGDNIVFEAAAGAGYQQMPAEQRLDSVRKLMPIVDCDARLRAVAALPALRAVVARIMGENPRLSQDMALLKPPRIGREKPWHQDMAYFDFPTATPIVGAWIALDEALPANGCMMLIPGSHRAGPVPHWKRRDWQICDTDVQVGKSLAVPLPPGGCLLFHCLLHHGTPPSQSDQRRWALQFHYRPQSVAPFPNSEQRLRAFGTDGLDASC